MQALFVNPQYLSAILASPYTNLAVKQKLTAKEPIPACFTDLTSYFSMQLFSYN